MSMNSHSLLLFILAAHCDCAYSYARPIVFLRDRGLVHAKVPALYSQQQEDSSNVAPSLEGNSTAITLEDQSSSHHHDDAAMHQVEHRLTEKGGMKLAERFVETTVDRLAPTQMLAKGVVKSTAGSLERVGERLAEQTGDRIIETASERIGERLVERAGERIGEQASERAGERLAARAGERLIERSGESLVLHTGERVGERLGSRIWKKVTTVVDRVLEPTAKRGFERASERALERSAERGGERIAESVAERSLERIAKRSGERVAERAGERAVERAGERASERAVERLVGATSERVAVRIGRGLLITLPALGGIFALFLLKSDIMRVRDERSKRLRLSTACFVGAGLADMLDSVLHFFIAYALFAHLGHHALVLPEKLSMGCAVTSTLCALAGELISLHLQKRKQSGGEPNDIAGEL